MLTGMGTFVKNSESIATLIIFFFSLNLPKLISDRQIIHEIINLESQGSILT